jgi:cytochrome c553
MTFAAFCAIAASVAPVARASDAELGRYLSSECMTCHGGSSHRTIPDIFGMAEARFAEIVKAYREKRLANQVMQTVASRLSDEEIAALAAYFASTKKRK